MHKNGIYINDIDIVIITHDHLDHNADAKVISSLLYDLNNYKSADDFCEKTGDYISKEDFEYHIRKSENRVGGDPAGSPHDALASAVAGREIGAEKQGVPVDDVKMLAIVHVLLLRG